MLLKKNSLRKHAIMLILLLITIYVVYIIYINYTFKPMKLASEEYVKKLYFNNKTITEFNGIGGKVKLFIGVNTPPTISPGMVQAMAIDIALLSYTPSTPIFKGTTIEVERIELNSKYITLDYYEPRIPAESKGIYKFGYKIATELKEKPPINNVKANMTIHLKVRYITWIGITLEETHKLDLNLTLKIEYH